MLLLSSIIELLEERRRQGFSTTLQKIRAHTSIRGNNLADAAAKLAVPQYDSLPESQKLKVDLGEVTQPRKANMERLTKKIQANPHLPTA